MEQIETLPAPTSVTRRAQGRPLTLSDAQRARARQMRLDGKKVRDIAAELGVSKSVAHRAVMDDSTARDFAFQKMLRDYGLDEIAFNAMWFAQQGRCAICRHQMSDDCCIDHDHKTGAVRGMLCRACNCGLGSFRDDVANFAAAILYLSRRQSIR